MERPSREQRKEEFKQRMKEEQNRKEGGFYSSLFRKDVAIPFMKCGEGYHTIDILDYIAGKNDPSPGKLAWVFEFYIYSNVGAGQGPILSLAKTFGLPDPIWEDRAKRLRNGENIKSLRPLDPASPRALFNVICLDSEEEEKKGVQVFHTSSYLFTDYLREMAKGSSRPGMAKLEPLIDFCDPNEGKSIKFKREGLETNTKFILHTFVDRPAGFVIPDKLLNSVFTLDELIYIPTYEEVQIYYYGKGEAMPSARTLNTEKEQSEQQRTRYQQQEVVDEKKKEEQQANPCPSGHIFGKDIDKYPKECEACNVWKECAREARQIEVAAKAARQIEVAAKAEDTSKVAEQTVKKEDVPENPGQSESAQTDNSSVRRRRRV